MPTWGADLVRHRLREHLLLPQAGREHNARSWDDVPEDIKNTFERLGIPEAERKFLAGVGAQYESEVIYHNLQKDLEDQGVLFLDTDQALREHAELFREYWATVIPATDNKFAALNSAVWSGGSFIYVPTGVKVELPLQAYFRINAQNMGQFERTLIIVDEDAYVHYVEGCTAPTYSSDSLHSAVVEIIVKPRRPLPLHDDPELVEQRLQPRHEARRGLRGRDHGVGRRQPRLEADDEVPGRAPEGRARARRDPVDRLRGRGPAPGRRRQGHAHGARHDQRDHVEVDLHGGGRSSYRGLLRVNRDAERSRSKVVCDALILDEASRAPTRTRTSTSPRTTSTSATRRRSRRSARSSSSTCRSRGLSEAEASAMIVAGFIEPITKELPLEYAVELNRLIQLQMEGSVG